MLIVDNYDSFTYNIVQYVKILGINPIVIKNDEMSLEEIKKLKFERIILSPGWGNPDNSGVTMEVIVFANILAGKSSKHLNLITGKIRRYFLMKILSCSRDLNRVLVQRGIIR